MTVTRRTFLMQLAASSGYTAAAAALTTLGLGAPTIGHAGQTAPLQLAPSSGKGIKVLVLGAGIAGLVSAYELRKAGYQVQLVEARDRVGGPCHSIMTWHGDRLSRLLLCIRRTRSGMWARSLRISATPSTASSTRFGTRTAEAPRRNLTWPGAIV